MQPGEGDVTQPVARTIFGIPLFAVPDDIIDPGVVWGISKADSFTVIRSDVTIEANPYSAFNRDSLQIRGVLRVAFGFPNEPSVVKIQSTPDGS